MLGRRCAPRRQPHAGALGPLLVLLAALAGAAAAQTPAGEGEAARIQSPLTTELLESKIAEAEAAAGLDEPTRTALIEQYRAVISNLEQLAAHNAQAAAFRAAIDSAPRDAEQLQRELEALGPLPEPPVQLPPGASLEDIRHRLTQKQAEAASLLAQRNEIDQALQDGREQPSQLRREISETEAALAEVDEKLNQPLPEDLPAAEREAQRWRLETQRDVLRAEILMLEQKVLSSDARRLLAEARRDLIERTLERLEAQRAYLENEADRVRRREADRIGAETTQAERAAKHSAPIVRALAEGNREIAEQIDRATTQLDQIDEEQAALEETRKRVEDEFQSARQRLEAAGLTRAIGQLLMDQRAELPDPRQLARDAAQRAEVMADLALSQVLARDQLRKMRDLDAVLADWFARFDVPEAERAALEPEVREQLERRRELLDRLVAIENSYQNAIADLDLTASQLIDLVRRYDEFLDERLLWVRSNEPVTEQSFAALPEALAWLSAPEHWRQVVRLLGQQALGSPWLWLGVLAVALLLAADRRLRAAIRARAEPLRRISTDRFGHTLAALGLTLVLAAPWPLLCALLGWQLSDTPMATGFTKAAGHGLLAVVVPFYYLRAVRLLCLPGGVAERHFRWPAETLHILRRDFRLAALVLLPIGFLTEALANSGEPMFIGTFVRLAVALLAVGFAIVLARLLHPNRGVLRTLLKEHPQGWLNRLRTLWYPFVVGGPVVLALIALLGYLYTAGVLLRSLVSELWLALALVVAHQLIVRWLIVTRRSLALKAALERRAAREAQREAAEKGTEPARTAEEEVDLASLDSQTRQLLNSAITIAAGVGLWLIWSDVLPALNVFQQVTLWTYTSESGGVSEVAAVTLADLGLILVIVLAAVIAGRNLPALLEILLLKNSEITAGGRYTIITLTGYLITAIGAVLVFGALGLSWGEVQWLIAALGVGIGFGLQEIVANFISGLIILFERPVRVGDIVTIGDTTGTVTNIEIRATTIRNWDQQELLVPNKEFITGRLLNWTLSDQINRLTIPVRVEYGSDTRTALAILAEVAEENDQVLDDPAPLITFEGFGDDSLNLVLRCYLGSVEYWLAVTTALHQAIDDKFRAADIGIAFPQRDVHLHTAQPLDIRMQRPPRSAASDAAGG